MDVPKFIHSNIKKTINRLLFPFHTNKTVHNAFKIGKGGQNPIATNIEVKLEEDLIKWILILVGKIFMSQPVFLELNGPINICGDIHGQYADLLQIFYTLGFPDKQNYLFMGDYVDRGNRSLEVILLLFCYKIIYPNSFFLLRGNHETGSISKQYGFYSECIKRGYSVKLWKLFVDTFNKMPLSAIIFNRILCMHGGISPNLNSLEDLKNIKRPLDIPDSGIACDLVWADPDPNTSKWGENERGVSYVFGENVLKKFLDENGIDLICRGHQVVEDGYEFFAGRRLVTVFSAPRYCGDFDNKGAVLVIKKNMECSFVCFD